MKPSIWSLALTFALGCSMPQEGHLYPLEPGGVSRFRILNTWSPSSDVEAELSDGTRCHGRLSRTGPGAPVLDPDTNFPDVDRGLAVLACGANVMLDCQLVHRLDGGYAFGSCRDQRGVKYRLLF